MDCIDDGQCAIDVKVDPSGPQRDISNYLQITEAASAVIRTCVDDEQAFSTGGFANHLGTYSSPFSDTKLGVIFLGLLPDYLPHLELVALLNPPNY